MDHLHILKHRVASDENVNTPSDLLHGNTSQSKFTLQFARPELEREYRSTRRRLYRRYRNLGWLFSLFWFPMSVSLFAVLIVDPSAVRYYVPTSLAAVVGVGMMTWCCSTAAITWTKLGRMHFE